MKQAVVDYCKQPRSIYEIKESADTLTKERKEKILEFCKEPRGIKEIEKHIGTTIANQYVKELINQGKLKYTIAYIPYHRNQKYISTEVEYKALSEIGEHFNLTLATRKGIVKGIVKRLLETGKICYTEESLRLGECDGNRRLIKNG